LPKPCIIPQIAEFKSGARKNAKPQRLPVELMTSTSKAATDEEMATAAAYFSKLKPRKIITTTETKLVPKPYVAGWLFTPMREKDKEAIGERIIELQKDPEQFASQDTPSEFIASVPVGSVAKMKSPATAAGNGKTLPCGTCHGADLRGVRQVVWYGRCTSFSREH
jgi:cytochrome c553